MQPHPDRGRPVASGITVEEDAGAVFRAAIAAGVLSAEPADRNWAGHYFYMFHDRDGAAWFKQSLPRTPIRGDSRAHVTMDPRRAGGPA
ncbi:MAG: hypothetical protein F4114_04230 [Rhodospirillaceae bacterium]|nr:hypothetical protein [Rhodospirillaceae bacterium]MYI48280.1 hypothetical protein [Rhodospirillaceae bacterium]